MKSKFANILIHILYSYSFQAGRITYQMTINADWQYQCKTTIHNVTMRDNGQWKGGIKTLDRDTNPHSHAYHEYTQDIKVVGKYGGNSKYCNIIN